MEPAVYTADSFALFRSVITIC